MNTIKKWFSNDREIINIENKLKSLKHYNKLLLKYAKNSCLYNGGKNDNDWGINFWVFPSSMTDNQINQALINMDILEDTDRGIFDDNDWDCSGKTLMNKPYISKRTKTRVLVTQTWSIDI